MGVIEVPIPARKARLPRPLCAVDNCGNTCSAPDHTFCSVECANGSRSYALDSNALRSHFYRLGSRKAVAALYGVSHHTIFRQLPTNHVDQMLRGEMIQIGRVLAKRCVRCGVTWPLDRYHVAGSLSGCGSHCMTCYEETKRMTPFEKGYAARRTGAKLEDNPFDAKETPYSHNQWARGWRKV